MHKLLVLFAILFLIISTDSFLSAFEPADEPGTVSEEALIRFAIISDRTGGHVPGVHGQIAREIEWLKPDFVMSVGDMIEGYVDDSLRIMSEWDEYDSIVAVFSMPYHMTPGNHDVWSDLSERIYRQRVGPPYYDFIVKNTHFIVLDMGRWDVGNQLPSEQLDWLLAKLENNTDAHYTMVFTHKPTWYETAAKGKTDTLHTIFKEYDVDAVFTGHYHEYFSQKIDDVMYTSLGSSGGATHQRASSMEYHYAWVTVTDYGIHVAPIKMGSVLPWDESTAYDKMAYDRLKHYGLAVEYAAEVDEDLKVPEQLVNVIVDNTLSKYDIEDSLKWDTDRHWKIQ
jgi:predicted phosphodiesterase